MEEEYFGKIDTRGKKRAAALELYRELSGGKAPVETDFFLPFHKALRFAKAFQPWDDPTMPGTKVSRDLLDFICEELGIDPENEEETELPKFFTSLGSPLDERHGVDAFIEYRGRRVLIDVTKNPAKTFDDSTEDRVIMEELPDWTDLKKRAAYVDALRKYAKHMAGIIRLPVEHTREAGRIRATLR